LTEMNAESADVRAPVRFALWESGRVVARRAEPKPDPPKAAEPAPAPPVPVVDAPPTPPAAGPDAPATLPAEAAPSSDAQPEPAPAQQAAPAREAAPATKPKRDHRIDEKKAEEYRDYFEFTEGLRAIPPHRILAVNRGEKEHILKVSLDWD